MHQLSENSCRKQPASTGRKTSKIGVQSCCGRVAVRERYSSEKRSEAEVFPPTMSGQ